MGIVSAGFAILAGLISLPILATTGISLALICTIALVLMGNRQNWRQLKGLQNALENKDSSTKPVRTKVESRASGKLPRIGAAFDHVHRIQARRADYETFALRSRSVVLRDSFALAATDNRFKYEDLTRFVAVQRLEMLGSLSRSDLKQWNHTAFLALARIQVNQRAVEGDLENAVRYFEFAETVLRASFRPTDRLLYLEALGDLFRFAEQSELVTRYGIADRYPLQVTLMQLNAVQNSHGAVSAEWLDLVNGIYKTRNLSSIEFTSNIDKKPLDRLYSKPARLLSGPLVTVIVPTYQGGAQLLTALGSLLQQSWQDLEIIVVDDASGPDYQKYLEQAASLSPKIRVIKQEQNLGAYCARNIGVKAAHGEYITVHDDDDWSHSDKIATQVQHLMANPEIPGNMSAHIRTSEELKLLRINVKPLLTQPNFSSLMIHRETFNAIGAWDEVNKGADSEFRDRLEKYSGVPVEVLDEVPLGFTRTHQGSLTSGEVSRGYVAPNRRLYLEAFTRWHEETGRDPDALKPSKTQNYPVPTSMRPGWRNADLGIFDVVFMTDFRFPGGTTSLTLAEIRAASQSGFRVGYIHEESPTNRSQSRIAQELFDMQLNGEVHQIALEDSADIRLLVARHPVVAQFLDNRNTNLRVQQTVLIVNNPPVLHGGSGMVFDLPICVQNLDRLFNTRCKVIAESGVTQRLCKGIISTDRLSNITWPGLITLRKVDEPDFTNVPILGRHSRDHKLKWPSKINDFHAAYTSSDYQTRFLGGTDALVTKLGPETIRDKIVYKFGTKDVQVFLDEIDFWVYYHDDKLTESFGMAIAEAMAAGKVVILPPYLETNFGDGAIYSDPSGVKDIVVKIWNDPDSYRTQAHRATAYVHEHFSMNAFVKRITSLIGVSTKD
ncbi:hypothetical protein A6F49_00965 [Enteractinococcus helveticum]|uniref:Glycosyltransferase 2-like domain-containing protein n=1 Tax=Enteractinococcus helveticum TaxID=1837282 RepID=A0A1B7LVC4_9MICC|nr:hypothetical protein A6F49_00965 [Enteractinococcus helveticum]